jgi:DNA helicase-2/ATP-dependent DNA helicase PcrA
LAGPGSGKTRLLVGEIATKLRQGVDPAAILGLTFTRRAGKEMQQRLAQARVRTPWLGTFHALARRILVDLRLLPKDVDLSALIPDATRTLEAGKAPVWLRKVQYIAVDEAQDMDAQQVAFLQSLRAHSQQAKLLLVGDPDQSIFRFRGADPRFLLQAPKVFHLSGTTRTLGDNHRSAPAIVHAARALLSPVADPEAPCHKLAPHRTESHPAVRWISVSTAMAEAVRIFEEVRTLLALGIPPTEIAILVRVRAQMDALAAEARRWNVPLYLPPRHDQLDDGQEVPEVPPDAVHLLTMHQSKGTEYTVVFLAGVQEGLMPHRRADSDEARYEELRLLYVAVTRAKQLIWFSCHGQPSRFLASLQRGNGQPAGGHPTSRPGSPAVQPPPGETLLRQIFGWIRRGFGG